LGFDSLSDLGGVGGGRTIYIHYGRLLTEQEINLVRENFHEDAEFLLEEALRNAYKYFYYS
jgi:hypothetical protein